MQVEKNIHVQISSMLICIYLTAGFKITLQYLCKIKISLFILFFFSFLNTLQNIYSLYHICFNFEFMQFIQCPFLIKYRQYQHFTFVNQVSIIPQNECIIGKDNEVTRQEDCYEVNSLYSNSPSYQFFQECTLLKNSDLK